MRFEPSAGGRIHDLQNQLVVALFEAVEGQREQADHAASEGHGDRRRWRRAHHAPAGGLQRVASRHPGRGISLRIRQPEDLVHAEEPALWTEPAVGYGNERRRAAPQRRDPVG